MNARQALPLVIPLLLAISGCAGVLVAGGPPHGRSYSVPPGHMPPPGQCRIWYPGVPPGRQPPPGDCHELGYRAPPDAFLVYGE